jgi:hypothetical protein
MTTELELAEQEADDFTAYQQGKRRATGQEKWKIR